MERPAKEYQEDIEQLKEKMPLEDEDGRIKETIKKGF